MNQDQIKALKIITEQEKAKLTAAENLLKQTYQPLPAMLVRQAS